MNEAIMSHIITINACNPGPMTLDGTNTYLVGTGNARALIDTGEGDKEDYIEKLTEVMKSNNVEYIDCIIITHAHYDHIGGIKDVLSMNKQFNSEITPRILAYDISLLPNDIIATQIKDGDIIHIEGIELQVICAPGHWDCVLGKGTAVLDDLAEYMKSLEKFQLLDSKVIYPGHGPVIDNPNKVLEYYITHRKERIMQVYNTLKQCTYNSKDTKDSKEGMTCMDLVKYIYTEIGEHLYLAASRNVQLVLDKLIKEGNIIIINDDNDDNDDRYKFIKSIQTKL